jgi:hypothetical protein
MPVTVKNKMETSVNFQLKGIELLNIFLEHPKQVIPDIKAFQFDIKLEHKINTDNKFIIVVIYIDLFNEQKDLKFGSLTSSCIFEISNFHDFVDSKNNSVQFPDDFLTTINSITISTARGIMFNQFRGTFLHNAYLPIVDPKSFIPQK